MSIQKLTEIRDGWIWPKNDIACWRYLNKRLNVPEDITKFCENKNVVIQAGGNAGLYVNTYSKLFETVYTFEPDPVNFYCLVNNTSDNVIKIQGCLGNNHNLVDISNKEQNPKKKPNTGGYRVIGNGLVPTFRLDDINFTCVDLIHLDIEGFEKFAILGALNTIKKFKPIIALEINGLSYEYYKVTDLEIKETLQSLGYQEVGLVDNDVIFKYSI